MGIAGLHFNNSAAGVQMLLISMVTKSGFAFIKAPVPAKKTFWPILKYLYYSSDLMSFPK